MNLCDVLGFSNGFNRCGGGGGPPPLWGMSKGEAMRPLDEDVGVYPRARLRDVGRRCWRVLKR